MSERSEIFDEFCGPGHERWENACFMDRALRLLPSIVCIHNQETKSNEYSNRSIGEVMGYTAEEVRGFGSNLMATLCHPEDLPRGFEHFKAIARLKDGQTLSFEYRMRHKAGQWIWLLSMDTVFDRDPIGRVRRHLGAAADITALKTAEQRALAASHAAEVANQDLRTFAYSISHDMKSPLSTSSLLLSELDRCHGSGLDPDAKQLLDKAQHTLRGMQCRLERVMDYTLVIDRDQSFEPVSLDFLIQDVLSDLEAELIASSACVDVGPLPTVSGRETELKALFSNLISNALKFRKPGVRPHVRVFDSSDQDENELCITVSDNGIGVPLESQHVIFEMFKRLHSEKVFLGNGLGLAICRRIAIGHGGDLQVRSKIGQGAAFTLTLPTTHGVRMPKPTVPSPGCEVR